MAFKTRKLVFNMVRTVVCVAALWWVLRSVTWYDRVTLADGTTVRAVSVDEWEALVERTDGERQTLPLAQLARLPDGSAAIQYGLASVLRDSYKGVLLLSVLIFAPVPFLQSLRFLMMYRAQDIRLSYWECTKLCFAGNFLNFVAVGTTGGDVIKAYYVCLHTNRRTEAVTTIFLDRLVGLIGLLALVGLIILFFGEDRRLQAFGAVIGLFLLGVTVLSSVVVSQKARSFARRLLLPARTARTDPSPGPEGRGVLARGWSWAGVRFHRVDQTTQRLIRHKPMVFGSVLVTMLLQLIAMSAWQAIVYALRMPWDLSKAGDYYAYLGGANVVACVPFTFQGIGTVEAYYKEFLVGGGVTVSQILCFAMATRLLQLLWSLPGVLVTMTGAYRPRTDGLATALDSDAP